MKRFLYWPPSSFMLRLLVFGLLMYAKLIHGQYDQDRKCPVGCECYISLDVNYADGGLGVLCLQGNMHQIPINELDRDIYELVIVPPPESPNFFSLGPIFTQPVPFSRIRNITITHSNIPSIGVNSFWGLQNLIALDLSHNNFTRISEDNFRGLVNLNKLYLEYNSIEEMPSDTFKFTTSLKGLNLSHNKITTLVPRLFRMLDELTFLDLSYNPLFELNPEVFKDIQHLTIFKCRACSLSRVNGQIYHLARHIEVLDLGDNLFKYLTADEFISLKKIKMLQLDGNQLSVIVDHVFAQNYLLESLHIQNNRLALLAPFSLNNLTKLTELNLKNNKLEKIHLQAFTSSADSLMFLDLSGNNLPLNEVAILLQIVPKIEVLGISNLSITDIPQNFFMYNDRITMLNVSHNKLKEFPIKLLEHTKTKHLKILDISNNELKTLNELDLSRMEAIPTVNLSRNAWHCDQCSMKKMLEYMKTTVLNETIRDLRCWTPHQFQDVMIGNLKIDKLDPCPMSLQAQLIEFSGLLVVVLVVLLTVAVTFYCTSRRNGSYYTNEDKNRQRNRENPEEPLTRPQNGNVATINANSEQAENDT